MRASRPSPWLTGYNDAAQLSKARPDIIVPDLLVLRTLMRRYALPSDTQDSININGLELDTFIGVPGGGTRLHADPEGGYHFLSG